MLKNTKNLSRIIVQKGPEGNPAQLQGMPIFTASFLITQEGQNALQQLVFEAKKGLLSPAILGQKLSEIAEAFPALLKLSALLSCGELISIAEAAALLGISRQTLYRRLKNGELPSELFTIKNTLKVRKSELIRIIAEAEINE